VKDDKKKKKKVPLRNILAITEKDYQETGKKLSTDD
jgi:hypothetical protein